MNLVIVESPAKGRTIEKYLGPGYKVLASFGHVRDLPKGELGVDTDHDFTPKYVIPPKARKTLKLLKDNIAKAQTVYMATDYDREGEAIAWHIVQATGLNKLPRRSDKMSDVGAPTRASEKTQNLKRITFHEITKEAIQESVKHPREIDMDLVNAQQARRILDRLVGYKLSPFLWRKIYKGLSAGRVQSVAVRLIVDRERERQNFRTEEYWAIIAKLSVKHRPANSGKTNVFEAILAEKDDKKIDKLAIKNQDEALKITEELKNAQYKVQDIEEKEEKRWAYPPFTTSTLQQEASKRLGFNAKKTMKLAQNLYEEGLITYMRTDSVGIAQMAINSLRKLIANEFGQEYLPEKPNFYKTKTKGAQEAHEAIRPTHIENLKSQISNIRDKGNFYDEHLRLYELIWDRVVASQMKPMILDTINVKISAANYAFLAHGQAIKFAGFAKVWALKLEEKTLPSLRKEEILDLLDILKEQHSTEPPGRFTEASLIKTLEKEGIGRPSTYAPTISTILDRGYVILDKKVFLPQEIGFIVTDLLVKYFPNIVDLKFTAKMEENLDAIAEGKENWVKDLREFYEPFAKNLQLREKDVAKVKSEEKTEEKCPQCGKNLVIKMGKFGKFIACPGFPECKFTKPIVVETGLKCPDCKTGDIIERKTKRGKTFWGCSTYPKCKWASWDNPTK